MGDHGILYRDSYESHHTPYPCTPRSSSDSSCDSDSYYSNNYTPTFETGRELTSFSPDSLYSQSQERLFGVSPDKLSYEYYQNVHDPNPYVNYHQHRRNERLQYQQTTNSYQQSQGPFSQKHYSLQQQQQQQQQLMLLQYEKEQQQQQLMTMQKTEELSQLWRQLMHRRSSFLSSYRLLSKALHNQNILIDNAICTRREEVLAARFVCENDVNALLTGTPGTFMDLVTSYGTDNLIAEISSLTTTIDIGMEALRSLFPFKWYCFPN